MADVTFQRSDYAASLYSWQLVDDVCAGQQAVKDRGDVYLPKPNPTDESPENKARYDQYKARAVFYNATGRTKQGLVGAGFRKVPTLEAPADLEYVSDDIDGAGNSIYQQSQSVTGQVIKKGRAFLLVDYPPVDGVRSVADMRSSGIKAKVVSYRAEQVVNWKTTVVGAEQKLSLVVIKELDEEDTADGFGVEAIPQYRVLRLTEEGYTQATYREDEKKKAWVLHSGPVLVRDGSGKPWREITGTFVGSNNNDPNIDQSPLYDMAEINIAHYRNSADYEDSAYLCGQPQVYMAGLSETWVSMLEEKGIYFGSRAILPLPENGSAGLLQAAANTLVKEAMDQKEAQMVALGARLVQRGTAVKTATEAQGEQEAEHSVLSLICSNVSEAYTKCLQWMAGFMGVSGDVSYEINQDFVEHSLDSQMLLALIQAWQSGKFPEADLWVQFRKYGLIDSEKSDEDIKAELETQDQGLGLDDGDIPAAN